MEQNSLKEFPVSKVSEIYLFFDYDRHNNRDKKISDRQLQEMLEFFNNETENGKLYINYPMVESIYYAKNKLPDKSYYSYTSNLSLGKKFKSITNAESYYKNRDFIQFKMNKKTQKVNLQDEEEMMSIRQNWQYLQEMNVKKANFICSGKNEFPQKTDDILQKKYSKINLKNMLNQIKMSLFSIRFQYSYTITKEKYKKLSIKMFVVNKA